jgi:hypothetical protein
MLPPKAWETKSDVVVQEQGDFQVKYLQNEYRYDFIIFAHFRQSPAS